MTKPINPKKIVLRVNLKKKKNVSEWIYEQSKTEHNLSTLEIILGTRRYLKKKKKKKKKKINSWVPP